MGIVAATSPAESGYGDAGELAVGLSGTPVDTAMAAPVVTDTQPPTPVSPVSPSPEAPPPTPVHTSSVAPSVAPSVAATPMPATPTPAPAVVPKTVETPAPDTGSTASTALAVVGYGSATTGGLGGRVITVRSWAELKAASESTGPRIVRLVGASSENWDGGGDLIEMGATMGNITIDGSEFGGEIMRGYFRVRASNVIFRELRIRTGDPLLTADYSTASPILLTGTNNPVRNIVIDHVSLMWGTEMNLAIYNDVSNVTVQNTIMAEGLQYTSRSTGEFHTAKCLNITVKGVQGDPWPNRITFYRNLLSSCTHRNPMLYNVEHLDWVNNVIYNGGNWAMHGNPRGLNYVGSVVRSGPDTSAMGEQLYRSDLNSDSSTWYFPNSVYLRDIVADGFAATSSFAAGVQRSTPYGSGIFNIPLIEPAIGVVGRVAAVAGPSTRDATDGRVIRNLLDRTTSGVFNASFEPRQPQPHW